MRDDRKIVKTVFKMHAQIKSSDHAKNGWKIDKLVGVELKVKVKVDNT